METETVQWLVGRYDSEGRLVTTRDGAQSVFSLTRAKTLAKKRGPEWSLFHYRTNLSPEAQAQFEADARKAEEAAREKGQTYGSQWAP